MAIKIVLAEDEAIIRLDLRESLQEEGYEVVGDVGRGDLAVDVVRATRPDVAIFDIKMPGMSGLEAAKIVSNEKICPVVMLTAFSQREIIEQARDAGALAYLVKPFQRTDLVPAIELAIARFEEIRILTSEVVSLGAQLEIRKLIDRAKGLLIDNHNMSESDAYSYIQTMAMSQRKKMGEIAEQIIAGNLKP